MQIYNSQLFQVVCVRMMSPQQVPPSLHAKGRVIVLSGHVQQCLCKRGPCVCQHTSPNRPLLEVHCVVSLFQHVSR